MTASLRVRRLAPSAPLARFVDSFWMHSGYASPHASERVLPTGTMDMVFALDCEGYTASSLGGPRSESLALDTSRPFTAIGVHFRSSGGSPFFGVPSSDLRNQRVPLDLLWGRFASTLANRLWEADAPGEQFDILEEALAEKGRNRLLFHPAVEYAVERIDRSAGAPSVDALVTRIGMSRRRFLDVFQSAVGLSPKQFCRIRRFAAVLRQIDREPGADWVDISVACGYFDQAHFNHDFKAFAAESVDLRAPAHLAHPRRHDTVTALQSVRAAAPANDTLQRGRSPRSLRQTNMIPAPIREPRG